MSSPPRTSKANKGKGRQKGLGAALNHSTGRGRNRGRLGGEEEGEHHSQREGEGQAGKRQEAGEVGGKKAKGNYLLLLISGKST